LGKKVYWKSFGGDASNKKRPKKVRKNWMGRKTADDKPSIGVTTEDSHQPESAKKRKYSEKA